MIEIILLVLISGFSIYGLYWIYNKYDDSDDVKKMVAVFLAIIVVMMSSFLVFSATTRSIAMGQAAENESILNILLGITGGGYSPYYKASWGGTEPDQNFDRDSLINKYDQDADNDKVPDCWEYSLRFNPFQPDAGILEFKIKWIDVDEICVRCYPVQDITGLTRTITLYLDNIIQEEKEFKDVVEFYVAVNPDQQYTLEAKVTGLEAAYANKCNNIRSYVIPAGLFGSLGVFYADLENQIQGIIRNSPLFGVNNEFSILENMFRGGIAGIPLFLWFLIIAGVVTIVLINRRRRKKGRPPLLSFGRKKEKFEKGSTRIQLY